MKCVLLPPSCYQLYLNHLLRLLTVYFVLLALKKVKKIHVQVHSAKIIFDTVNWDKRRENYMLYDGWMQADMGIIYNDNNKILNKNKTTLSFT